MFEFEEIIKQMRGADNALESLKSFDHQLDVKSAFLDQQQHWLSLVDAASAAKSLSPSALESIRKATIGNDSANYALREIEAREQTEREHLTRLIGVQASQDYLSKYQSAITAASSAYATLNNYSHRNEAIAALSSAHENLSHILSHRLTLDSIAANATWHDIGATYRSMTANAAAEFAVMRHSAMVADSALLAQQECLKMEWARLSTAQVVGIPDISSAGRTFTTVVGAYSDLMRSIDQERYTLASFAPIVSSGPPIEIFTGARVFNFLAPESDDVEEIDVIEPPSNYQTEIDASLEDLLASVNPKFQKLWQGARTALHSNNPDYGRHVTTSLRELVSHLLRTLAPDEQVKSWSSHPEHFVEGHPTRKARMQFMCRGINHGPFEKFLAADVKLNIELIDLFNRGTHGIESAFTHPQLQALLVRTASFVRFVVLVSRAQ